MKLNYYGYSVQKFSNGKQYLMDLRKFISAFCAYNDAKYKNTFTHNGEHIYLLPVLGNIYLFLMTRSHEVIKKIKAKDLSVAEIYDLLERGEMIGVASYLYIEKSWFGLASTAMAPRMRAFCDFINSVFRTLDIDDYVFISHPMLTQSSKKDALNMSFMGRSTIQVDSNNGLFSNLVSFVGATPQQFHDVDSIEIVIKPRKRKNISDAVKKVIKAIPDDGLERMLVRAKEDIHDELVDLYIAGEGGVSDSINAREDRLVCAEIKSKVSTNSLLKEKVLEHEADEQFTKKDVKAIADYTDPAVWADIVSLL